ncbi:Gfo/Idh/MocA family protein [Cupriavidus basilensis]|uniref:Gfo/Idh/MocA family protein n=1 Tax=Cupriavidus basilensis TaxID=68895 RepID=UPI0020A686B6|nr:Gfo/Idh/MocA family oxidoreductase [Cupriavidus basilensis]MCP3022923.1 Gfo/Idh/MocA family oxidoreductase [Cupriavidus basilensis]
MNKTPIALIGAGAIGRTHIDRIGRSGNLQLAAIADPTDGGRALAQSLGVPWYADHRDMLEGVKPSGAVVATPNQTHVAVAIDCIERGVAALVEKPVADTVAGAQRLVDAQARTGVAVLVGHHRRHNPISRRAREIVQSGRLGRLVTASAMAIFLKPDAYFEAAWRRQAGGGPVLINLIHDIDLLRFLMGEIESVQAASSNAVRGFAVEDTSAAVLRFANGALATLLLSDAAASPWCWDFCSGEQEAYPRQQVQSHCLAGTHGSLSLPDLRIWDYRGERSWHAELTLEQSAVHKADPYSQQLQHFKAVIEGSEAPLCSALDGLRTLQATLAVHEAAVSAQSVCLEAGSRQ